MCRNCPVPKVVDIFRHLTDIGHSVAIHDAKADPEEARREHGITLLPALAGEPFDGIVGAVRHNPYVTL